MNLCKHIESYVVPEEESRIYGNNYDIVTIKLDFYCTKCDTHTRSSELVRRENKTIGIYSNRN